jgi:hypothetical protein
MVPEFSDSHSIMTFTPSAWQLSDKLGNFEKAIGVSADAATIVAASQTGSAAASERQGDSEPSVYTEKVLF